MLYFDSLAEYWREASDEERIEWLDGFDYTGNIRAEWSEVYESLSYMQTIWLKNAIMDHYEGAYDDNY